MRFFDCGDVHYVFGEDGFPAAIRLPRIPDHHNLLLHPIRFTLVRADGGMLRPAAGERTEILTGKKGTAQIVEFNGLALMDAEGKAEPGFSLCLRYELYSDGTAFADAVFLGDAMPLPSLKGFELCVPLALSAFETVR